MRLKIAGSLAVALVLIATIMVTFAASAQAATRTRPRLNTAQRVYAIDTRMYATELKVKVKNLMTSESRARSRMTACLTNAFVPIFTAAQTQTNASASNDLALLVQEAGAEYQITAIKPVLTPLISAVHQLAALPLTTEAHAALKSYLKDIRQLQDVHVCADARAWVKAGLSAAAEPSGTVQALVTLSAFSQSTSSSSSSGSNNKGGKLSATQFRSLAHQRKQETKHVNALIKQAQTVFTSWLAQLVTAVQRRVPSATTTTTTGTATTTAGTTTT
ncbi:MAG: hypothetical protein ACP5H2_08845 [Solirubrobacteraceae bacterium]